MIFTVINKTMVHRLLTIQPVESDDVRYIKL